MLFFYISLWLILYVLIVLLIFLFHNIILLSFDDELFFDQVFCFMLFGLNIFRITIWIRRWQFWRMLTVPPISYCLFDFLKFLFCDGYGNSQFDGKRPQCLILFLYIIHYHNLSFLSVMDYPFSLYIYEWTVSSVDSWCVVSDFHSSILMNEYPSSVFWVLTDIQE